MTLRTYLILFSVATVIAWAGWILILISINPFTAESIWIAAFYLSFFIALFGFFSLLGFFFRVWFSQETRLFNHLSISTRQGALLALFTCSLLILQANDFLSWWNIGLLILALILIEFFFTPHHPHHPSDS